MNVVVSDVNFIQFRRLNLLSTRYKLTLFKWMARLNPNYTASN
jgi:hypothetical protein